VEANSRLLRAQHRKRRSKKGSSVNQLATTAVSLQLAVDGRSVRAWLTGREVVGESAAQRILRECLRVARDQTLNLLEAEVARLTEAMEKVVETTGKRQR
jgi:hypothetical protein